MTISHEELAAELQHIIVHETHFAHFIPKVIEFFAARTATEVRANLVEALTRRLWALQNEGFVRSDIKPADLAAMLVGVATQRTPAGGAVAAFSSGATFNATLSQILLDGITNPDINSDVPLMRR